MLVLEADPFEGVGRGVYENCPRRLFAASVKWRGCCCCLIWSCRTCCKTLAKCDGDVSLDLEGETSLDPACGLGCVNAGDVVPDVAGDGEDSLTRNSLRKGR